MEPNIHNFLEQTSETQRLFKYCSKTDDYQFLKGPLMGHLISECIIMYKDEIKELLQETYDSDESNYHTKLICKFIANKYYNK